MMKYRPTTKWMYNVKTKEQKILSKFKKLPNGWKIGYAFGNNKMKDSKLISNGYESIYLIKGFILPDGWYFCKKEPNKKKIVHKDTFKIAYIWDYEPIPNGWKEW